MDNAPLWVSPVSSSDAVPEVVVDRVELVRNPTWTGRFLTPGRIMPGSTI
jgi:hypothetical protein